MKGRGPWLGRARYGQAAGVILLPGLSRAQSVLEVAFPGAQQWHPTQGQPSRFRGAGRGFMDGTGEWRTSPGKGFPGSCSLPISQCPSPVIGGVCDEAPNPHRRQ